MLAVHLLCGRDNQGNLKNLTFDDAAGEFRSGKWDISEKKAELLVGGVDLPAPDEIVSFRAWRRYSGIRADYRRISEAFEPDCVYRARAARSAGMPMARQGSWAST